MALDEEWTFHQLRDDTRHAVAWITSLGIKSTGHRLQRLIKDLDGLAAATDAGEMGPWSDEAEFRAGMFTLVEAADLRRIHRTYATRHSKGLVDKLKRAIKGPRAGTIDNSPDTATGRNYLAELSFAELFESRGISADIEHRPDVLTYVPLIGDQTQGAISWEVKRPQSPSGVEGCLSDAVRQIEKAVEHGVDDPGVTVVTGVAVLVLDHVIPPFFEHAFPNDALLRLAQQERLNQWASENGPLLRRTARQHTAGVTLLWRAIGRIPAQGGQRPIECRQLRYEGRGFPAKGYGDVAGAFFSKLSD